jgi:Protein of unknown function (DUF998)
MAGCPHVEFGDQLEVSDQPDFSDRAPAGDGSELSDGIRRDHLPSGSRAPGMASRQALAWTLAVVGLLAYNWWVLVPFKPGLMRSPGEFFSNLEVTGQPYAAAMQHADLLSGLALLAAFAVLGSRGLHGARREWLAMIVFAIAGGVGGIFPQVCADGVSPACFSTEWHFQLPASQYVHDGAGIVEFSAITIALLFACARTRGDGTAAARAYRCLLAGAVLAYPLLAVAYLLNRMGGVMEGVFFAGFTAMVLTQLVERTGALRPGLPSRRSRSVPAAR